MRLAAVYLTLLALGAIPKAGFAQLSGHKSEAQIEKMTVEQRVGEYCDEYLRHAYRDTTYEQVLLDHIKRDGLRAVAALTRVIDDYDPTKPGSKTRESDARCYAAEGLLSQIDERVMRLRGSGEGKKAVDSIRRLVEKMRTAKFDTAEGNKYGQQMRYKGTLSHLEHMQRESWFDISIKDTLELKYKIRLSSRELLGFIEYLISQDPGYPGWGQTEWYKDWTDVNEHGVPQQYIIVKNIEPFYKAYVEYKGKNKHETSGSQT